MGEHGDATEIGKSVVGAGEDVEVGSINGLENLALELVDDGSVASVLVSGGKIGTIGFGDGGGGCVVSMDRGGAWVDGCDEGKASSGYV